MPLLLERATVKPGRLVCSLRFSGDMPRYTTPEFMSLVLQQRPLLPQHACVNKMGPTFASVMNRTSLAHLFEHLVIDLQSQRCKSDTAVFTGTTQWVDKEAGTAQVEVSFKDDLEALAAAKDALSLINDLLEQ